MFSVGVKKERELGQVSKQTCKTGLTGTFCHGSLWSREEFTLTNQIIRFNKRVSTKTRVQLYEVICGVWLIEEDILVKYKVALLSIFLKHNSFATRHDRRFFRTETICRRPSPKGGRKGFERCVRPFLAHWRRLVSLWFVQLVFSLCDHTVKRFIVVEKRFFFEVLVWTCGPYNLIWKLLTAL